MREENPAEIGMVEEARVQRGDTAVPVNPGLQRPTDETVNFLMFLGQMYDDV